MYIGLQILQRLIKEDLIKLETSNIKIINKGLYEYLKHGFLELEIKVLEETNYSNENVVALELKYAKLSSKFDFYMNYFGKKQVLAYQIGEVKRIILEVINELTKDNYLEIEAKLKETLETYSDILKPFLDSLEIWSIIIKFKYQIMKYKIRNKILDNEEDPSEYKILILEDITKILKDENISNLIKKKLERYVVDPYMIHSNLKEILVLITLTEDQKEINEESLKKELNSPIYKSSDLEKKFTGITKEDVEGVNFNTITIPKIHEKYGTNPEREKKLIVVFLSSSIIGRENNVKELINIGFKDIRFLAEGLLNKLSISSFLSYKREFNSQGMDCDYEFDCAVIACVNDISDDDLTAYVEATSNQYLINYIITHKNAEFMHTSKLIYYAFNTLNYELLNLADLQFNDIINYFKKSNLKNSIMLLNDALAKGKINEDSSLEFYYFIERSNDKDRNFIYQNFINVEFLVKSLFHDSYSISLIIEYRNLCPKHSARIDKVVLAYAKKLNYSEISDYILATGSEELIDFLINETDFNISEDKGLQKFAIQNNHSKLLKIFMTNLEDFLANVISIEQAKEAITNYQNDESISIDSKKETFKSIAFRCSQEINALVLEQIYKFNDTLLIKEILDEISLVNVENALLMYEMMPEGNLKNSLTDFMFSEKFVSGELSLKFFDIKSLSHTKHVSYTIIDKDIKNDIDSWYASNHIVDYEGDIMQFIRKYYPNKRLNWSHLLKETEHLDSDLQYEAFKLGYLSIGIDIIKHISEINIIKFSQKIVNDIPSSITDFISYLSLDDILNLSEESLHNFAKYYEEKLTEEGTSIKIKIHEELINYQGTLTESLKELLTYIMISGLVNTEFLIFAKNINIPLVEQFVLAAIKNSKENYLRPYFLAKYLGDKKINDSCANIIFLTEFELNEMLNNENESAEMFELKARKYYGDLIKLIPKVSELIQYRIVESIAKSNIREYIFYIKSNHPEFLDFLLENINDVSIYKELIDYTGELSIDDALRINLLSESTSRK